VGSPVGLTYLPNVFLSTLHSSVVFMLIHNRYKFVIILMWPFDTNNRARECRDFAPQNLGKLRSSAAIWKIAVISRDLPPAM
jgi:hypothetical protein